VTIYSDSELDALCKAPSSDSSAGGTLTDDGEDPIEYAARLHLFETPCIEDKHVPSVELSSTDLACFNPAPEIESSLVLDIVQELLHRGPFPIARARERPFPGQGIYAIFYQGSLPAYAPIVSHGSRCPIYVGKSVQEGRRKGLVWCAPRALWQRLVAHARSIEMATNLDVKDFTFRFITLPDQWVSFAEHAVIKLFQPLWNSCLDGFGNHAVGTTRQDSQLCTEWDTYHPGRDGVAMRPRSLADVAHKISKGLTRSVYAFNKACERLRILEAHELAIDAPRPAIQVTMRVPNQNSAVLPEGFDVVQAEGAFDLAEGDVADLEVLKAAGGHSDHDAVLHAGEHT
jgi:hypothetical protein